MAKPVWRGLLVQAGGRYQGKLAFTWRSGVLLAHITAATRATHRLLVTVSGEGGFGQKIAKGFAAPPLTSP